MCIVAHARAGFTLIELLITILVIGLLAAIGLAVYNGQRMKAYHAEAKTVLRDAYTAARAYHTEHDGFCDPCRAPTAGGQGITNADLVRNERSLSATPASTGAMPGRNATPRRIWVVWDEMGTPPDREWVTLCNVSRGNRSFCIVRNSGITAYGSAVGSMIDAYYDAINPATSGW